jgi:hypothetical protein
MTLSSSSAHVYAVVVTLIVLGTDVGYAQVTSAGSTRVHLAQLPGGQPRPIIGQPPGRNSSIIGQPVPGQQGVGSPSNYPGTGSSVYPYSSADRDVVRDKLDRAREDAADIDRDGRISPYEASRMPGQSVPPGATVGTPLPPSR